MAECEMYRDKKAIDVTGRAMSERGYVFCRIPRGYCPYNNEGNRIINSGVEGIVCNSHGQVDEAGLIDQKRAELINQNDDDDDEQGRRSLASRTFRRGGRL